MSFNQRRRSEILVSYILDQELSMTQHIVRVTCGYVVMLQPTASTPSDTSSSRPGTRRSSGSLVHSFEAWLRQFSFSRFAKVGDHPSSTCSECSSVADFRLTDERTRDTSSEAAPVCDPPTPLNILSRVVALRSASVRYHTPVAGPLAWNDLPPSLHCITDSKRFSKHLKKRRLLSSTHCRSNACLNNYVRQHYNSQYYFTVRHLSKRPVRELVMRWTSQNIIGIQA